MSNATDVVMIGGGIVGLATALEATTRFPRLQIVVLEKEPRIATHQTGRNSGVIHSGIYYKPGSAKAKLCVAGAAAMVAFCREHAVSHEICGKIIVAVDDSELPRLEELRRRAEANGVPHVTVIGPERLRELEPHTRGVRALHVPGTGITDYSQVAQKYAELVSARGGEVRTATAVHGIVRDGGELVLQTSRGDLRARYVVNCAGLHSDRIARLAGERTDVQIVPFRGEYYELAAERASLVRGLIYPVPDPRLPFLGVHFTRRISGGVEAGPNAVLALGREAYGKTEFVPRDALECASFPGFWHMARRFWRTGAGEYYRSFSKAAFTRALQRLVPELQGHDLAPGGAGIRAQAVARDGKLLDDFTIVRGARAIHVLNVPSPAATASLLIAREIVTMAQGSGDWPARVHSPVAGQL